MHKHTIDYHRFVDFPVVGGVEVRTFGDEGKPPSYRCVKAVFCKRDHSSRAGGFSFKVDSNLMLIDEEQGGLLIENVRGLDFEAASDHVLFGRLKRETADRVVTVAPGSFSRGYYFKYGGIPSRVVSEAFMLTDVAVVDQEEFQKVRDAAMKAAGLSQDVSGGGWGQLP